MKSQSDVIPHLTQRHSCNSVFIFEGIIYCSLDDPTQFGQKQDLLQYGHLFFVFKPNLFVKDYNDRIKENVKLIKKLPKIKNIKEILYPGENKFKRFKINSKKKIKIPKNILKSIKELTFD